jgi:uncharacterized protein YutE (UPF0331/DUF86 family)
MRLLAQLQTLDEALLAWQRYAKDISFEKFAGEKDTQYMVCHAMLLSIQASIDIATGMAVQKTPKRPDTYRETFKVLGKFGVIPEDLAAEMSKLAGFRNILVHEYTGLDVKRVYSILQDDFTTMDSFRKRVREFVKENKNQNNPG